ncbi:hypothetical protein MRX96_017595 [Rhipicephalus microplus]
MRGLLVLMVVLEASAQSSQQHARHWRNYLNGLLAQLAQEEPHRDLRHELWKDMFSHRVRSFLVGEQAKALGEVASLISTSSSDSPHMHRFLDIINAHGARHLREPAPPLQCRCSDRENEAGNGSSLLAQLVTSSTTREPPLLLVVPGLMVAPRGGPFAIVRGVEGASQR